MYSIDSYIWAKFKDIGWWNKLWWKYISGEEIVVAWPHGKIIVDETHPSWDWTTSAKYQTFESADPNDWYRPWLEEHVGKQGWDWNWQLKDNNAAENRLTIKLRKKHSCYASYIALKWS